MRYNLKRGLRAFVLLGGTAVAFCLLVPYYTGTVTLDEADVAQLTAKGLTLVVGTPVEAFIKPAPRTIASHLLRPWRLSYRRWPINRDRFERISRRDSSFADRS